MTNFPRNHIRQKRVIGMLWEKDKLLRKKVFQGCLNRLLIKKWGKCPVEKLY